MTETRVEEACSEPPLRGAGLLRRLDELMLRLDRATERLVPAKYNPFVQTGAIATTAFLVAALTGIALLIWYRPSVNLAYESVLAMEASRPGSFLRTLHRYSSDVCIFFVFIHALRLCFAGRFVGARWLAWVSGIALLGLLWLVGWTGYWLVWDQPAQLIAESSARVLDLVPVFSEPVSRSFLADALVPTLFFFVIFFTHMLLPLAMGVGLWLHVARMQRAQVLTSRWMGIWTVGTLVLLSLIIPAAAGPPADMGMRPENLSIDAWYLAPLILTDRLGTGMLLSLLAIASVIVLTMPWWMRRGKTRVAEINTSMCNGCTLCARDCPYDAIVMVPRTDGRRYAVEARIDPSRCVGCGICAGACNPGAIGLDWLPVQATRKRIDDWIDAFIEEAEAENDDQQQGPVIAFLCSESAAARFVVDGETGRCKELPGYRVVAVPCAGWVQPISIERALRRGAAGVMIVGCHDGEAPFREGNRWLRMRLSGGRKPALRREKVEVERIRHVVFDRTRPTDFIEEAQRFRAALQGTDPQLVKAASGDQSTRHIAGGVILAAVIGALVVAGSYAPYVGPPPGEPELVVSVKHRGELEENCRTLSEEELARRPAHMRATQDCERRRASVVVEVLVNDESVYHEAHTPRGITGDGPMIMLEHLELAAGTHTVEVRVFDSSDDTPRFVDRRELEFLPGMRQVILFDTGEGFRHFAPTSRSSP